MWTVQATVERKLHYISHEIPAVTLGEDEWKDWTDEKWVLVGKHFWSNFHLQPSAHATHSPNNEAACLSCVPFVNVYAFFF